MKIKLIAFSKSDEIFIAQGVKEYEQRIKRYSSFSIHILKPSVAAEPARIKKEEAQLLLKNIDENAQLILLDDKGKTYTSETFATFISQKMNESTKEIVFVIGGAYGFDEEIYKRAQSKISLSSFTFPHQLCRLIFVEQLYRAFTIIKNEKYHHA
jgi:23S rRNA (pseudouridine1915-N3)-methyltransferase